MPVKRSSGVVLGVDHECKNAHFGAQRPYGRVSQQGAAEFSTLIPLVDGQPPKSGDRDRWIPRQKLDQVIRHLRQVHAAGCERVVARDLSANNVHRTIAGTDPPTNILPCPAGKILVEGFVPA